MQFKGFIGPAYDLRNFQYDCQTCVNWTVEVNEVGEGKEGSVAQFIPRKGLVPVVTDLAGASRGGYVASNGTLYWVFGDSLYRINTQTNTTEGWSATLLYTGLANNNNPVFMTDNGQDLFISAAFLNYAFNFVSGVTTQLSGGAYRNSSSLTYMDNYIVFSNNLSNQFFWTDLLSTTANSLNFASAEANPEQIVGLINNNLDLWIFGKKTTELWYNYGQNNITFQRRPNLLIESGCAAASTIQKISNTLMWMSSDERGGPMVMMANSYTPIRVSTFPLEKRWQQLNPALIQFASAYTMQDGGHQLYVLNIPGAEETWVYDLTASTQLNKPIWTTWTSSDGEGGQGRHRGQGHAYSNGWHITGDYVSGTLYAMDENTFTDNGNYIMWERPTPHMANQMNRIFYDRLTLDFFTGGTDDVDLNPQVMIQFSDDGGATWSNERWESAGAIGEFDKRVEFFRLGSGRNRVFRIRCTDPMYWAISGASLDIRLGKN